MAILDADAALVGDSSFVSNAGLLFSVASSMAGTSVANINALSNGTSLMSGSSALLFDPTKITIVNFSRGPQIPETAKPVTIPTIRITPPAPPAATYSVGSPRRRGPLGL